MSKNLIIIIIALFSLYYTYKSYLSVKQERVKI